jgi:hypothetical protein
MSPPTGGGMSVKLSLGRRSMIESLMLCGIGLLGGCLLMLAFFPIVHERAVRLTRQSLVEATPMAINEMQADKDHLRAQFAMSLRRLEVNIEEMRAKTINHSSEISKQNLEINRLYVELDKKTAMILALRARENVRKSIVRRIVKILLFTYNRSSRRSRADYVSPRAITADLNP